MKGIRRTALVMVAVIMATCIQPMGAKAASVKLNKTKLTLEVGEIKQLNVKSVKASKVKWSSSKKKVATVSKGYVKAVNEGTTNVVAKVGKKKLKCKVKVRSVPVAPTPEPTVIPTAVPTAVPTTAPTAVPTVDPINTYNTLATYIKTNGTYTTEDDGTPCYYIGENIGDATPNFFNSLCYYPNDDKLEFSSMYTSSDSEIVSLVYMFLNKTSISTGDLNFEVANSSDTILDSGSNIIVLNTINQNSNVDFGCTITSANTLANVTFKYGLSRWDSMIKQCGIINGLQAFGFTSYIN